MNKAMKIFFAVTAFYLFALGVLGFGFGIIERGNVEAAIITIGVWAVFGYILWKFSKIAEREGEPFEGFKNQNEGTVDREVYRKFLKSGVSGIAYILLTMTTVTFLIELPTAFLTLNLNWYTRGLTELGLFGALMAVFSYFNIKKYKDRMFISDEKLKQTVH